MKNMTGDDEWQTFNCYFDLLFGENLQDAEYCLLHICHGVEIDNPLLWWKVCRSPHSLFSFSLLLICLCRFMHQPLLVSPRITLLFQEPSFWSSNCFLSLGIFSQTSAHR